MRRYTPNPMFVFRDFLNRRNPPPLRILKAMAADRGLSLSSLASGAGKYKDAKGKLIQVCRVAPGVEGGRIADRLLQRLRKELTCFFTGAGSDNWLPTINIARRDHTGVMALICD